MADEYHSPLFVVVHCDETYGPLLYIYAVNLWGGVAPARLFYLQYPPTLPTCHGCAVGASGSQRVHVRNSKLSSSETWVAQKNRLLLSVVTD